MEHIFIGFLIIAALIVYVPRVFFLAVTLCAIFFVWICVAGQPDSHTPAPKPSFAAVARGEVPGYSRIPVTLGSGDYRWWNTTPDDICESESPHRCFQPLARAEKR
jgi:hypothetical protein